MKWNAKSYRAIDVAMLSCETRRIAENAVGLGILELTNRGQTYRVTEAGQELAKILADSVGRYDAALRGVSLKRL